MKKSLLLVLVILMLFMVGCGEKVYTEISEEDWDKAVDFNSYDSLEITIKEVSREGTEEEESADTHIYYNNKKLEYDCNCKTIDGEFKESEYRIYEKDGTKVLEKYYFDFYEYYDDDVMSNYSYLGISYIYSLGELSDYEFDANEKCYKMKDNTELAKKYDEYEFIFKVYIYDKKVDKIYFEYKSEDYCRNFTTEFNYDKKDEIKIPNKYYIESENGYIGYQSINIGSVKEIDFSDIYNGNNWRLVSSDESIVKINGNSIIGVKKGDAKVALIYEDLFYVDFWVYVN